MADLLDPDQGSPFHAAHGAPGAFFCPWADVDRGFADLLRWMLGTRREDRKPPLEIPVLSNDGAYLHGKDEPASVTWVGHATVAVQDGETVWLTDPHFGQRALVPRRHTPPGIPITAVPTDAFVVLSHNHYDHLDSWTVSHLPRSLRWFVPRGLKPWFTRRGLEVTELDWWESTQYGEWTLTCLPAQHWSNRFGVRRNATLWCSWLLDCGRRSYYFAGDSGYFGGFAEIARQFASPDVAMIPIGAYEPRWFMKPQHMNPAEALRAFADLNANLMVPIHWGTFDLTSERIDRAPKDLALAVAAAGIAPDSVRPMAIGERKMLADPARSKPGENREKR